jgi:hypothetical protein
VNPVADLRQSFAGWVGIARGRPEAARCFHPGPRGIGVALGWLLVAVLLSVAVQSVQLGLPSAPQLGLGLLAQGVTVGMLWLVTSQTLNYLKLETRVATLLVPILYGMAYMFIVAIPLTLLGPGAALLAVLGLAVAIGFAGRTVAGMKTGVAAAFAGLCLIVLVLVPNALYMLLLQLPPPA